MLDLPLKMAQRGARGFSDPRHARAAAMELSQIASPRLVHRCALLRLLTALKARCSAPVQMPRQERVHPTQAATAVTVVEPAARAHLRCLHRISFSGCV